MVGTPQRVDPGSGGQIETQSKLDHRANEERIADCVWPSARRFAGKVEGARRIGFPEVDSRSEPIVLIVAGVECRSLKKALADLPIASVIAEDEC